MPFYTRPNFEDRQVVQYNGDTITLSGETNINNAYGSLIIKAPTLDFTGTTTASTTTTIASVVGYLNSGKVSSFIVEPPIILVSGATGTTTVDVTGYYLGSLNSGGTVTWFPPMSSSGGGTFTGGTGSCITDLYVTNIHGCSPLNIQPTSPDNVIIAKGGGNVGIGTSPSNSYRLHVSGRTNTELRFADSGSTPSFSVTTNNNNNLIFSQVWDTASNSTFGLVFRGFNEPNFDEYGKQGDATLYASVNANGLNIMNNNGSSKEDYIRFYAGTNAQGPPDIHIQGTGTTRGFVGMGTTNPQAKLDVDGKTRTTNLQVTSGATTGYVLTALDSNGNAVWTPISGTGVVNKYTTSLTFTGSETKTITHNLNTKFVHCSVWDAVTNELITAQVVRNISDINNTVDITIATAGTYDILITG